MERLELTIEIWSGDYWFTEKEEAEIKAAILNAVSKYHAHIIDRTKEEIREEDLPEYDIDY